MSYKVVLVDEERGDKIDLELDFADYDFPMEDPDHVEGFREHVEDFLEEHYG